MHRLNRFFSWCFLIGGGALLSFIVPAIMRDIRSVPPGVFLLTALSALMAAIGWRNLKKPPPKNAEEHAPDVPIKKDGA